MKKIFYILASAIVALGAVACQNEVDENITPGTQNDVVSFTVSFDDNTRIALGTVENGEASFVFEANETLYLNYNDEKTFEFTNTPENRNTFTGEGEGLSEIVNNYPVTISNKEDLTSPSDVHTTFGEAAYFKFQGKIDGDVTLELSNYVIHCATGADEVTLLCDSYKAAYLGAAPDYLVLPANGEYWINLKNTYASEINVSYKINDTTVKEATLNAKVNGAWGYKIFNLGTLNTDMTIANVAALIEKAEAGSTITLPAGATITGSEILTIEKSIIIDGNGATLTVNYPGADGRAINISGAENVTIENLNVVCTGQRGINIIQGSKNVTLTDVNVTAANYAVNVAGSAAGAVVDIDGGVYNGLNVVNVGGTATVTIDNATINCNDNTSIESYSAIAIFPGVENATITATNCTFNISGDSHIASNSGTNCSITLSPEGEVVENVAAINYGDYAYVFSTLAEALEYAKEGGETVILLDDAVIAQAGTFKIDLNGHNLSLAEGYVASENGGVWTVVVSVAKVEGIDYGTLADALTASKGTKVITLLADATNVATACVINANGHALTTGDGYVAVKDWSKKDCYNVMAATASNYYVCGWIAGKDTWTNGGYQMFQTGDNEFYAFNVALTAANDYFKLRNNTATNDTDKYLGCWNGHTSSIYDLAENEGYGPNYFNSTDHDGQFRAKTTGTYHVKFTRSDANYGGAGTITLIPIAK